MEQRSSKEEEGNLNFIRRGPSVVSQTADELMLAPRTSLIFEKGLADRSCSLVSRFAHGTGALMPLAGQSNFWK